jgi:hypothetical protein
MYHLITLIFIIFLHCKGMYFIIPYKTKSVKFYTYKCIKYK